MSNIINSCGRSTSYLDLDCILGSTSSQEGYGAQFCNMDSLRGFNSKYGISGSLGSSSGSGAGSSIFDGAMTFLNTKLTNFKDQYLRSTSRVADIMSKSAGDFMKIIGNIGKRTSGGLENKITQAFDKAKQSMGSYIKDESLVKADGAKGPDDAEAPPDEERTEIENKDVKTARKSLREKGYTDNADAIIDAAQKKAEAEGGEDPLEKFKDIIEGAPSNKPADGETEAQRSEREQRVGRWMHDNLGTGTGIGPVDDVSSRYLADRKTKAGTFKEDISKQFGGDGLNLSNVNVSVNADGSAIIVTSDGIVDLDTTPRGLNRANKEKRNTAITKLQELVGNIPYGVKLFVNGQEIVSSPSTSDAGASGGGRTATATTNAGYSTFVSALKKGFNSGVTSGIEGVAKFESVAISGGVPAHAKLTILEGLSLSEADTLHRRLETLGDRPINIAKGASAPADATEVAISAELQMTASSIKLDEIQSFLSPEARLEKFARENNLTFSTNNEGIITITAGSNSYLDATKQNKLKDLLKGLPVNTKVKIGGENPVPITEDRSSPPATDIGALAGHVETVFTDNVTPLTTKATALGINAEIKGDTLEIDLQNTVLTTVQKDALVQLMNKLPASVKRVKIGDKEAVDRSRLNSGNLEPQKVDPSAIEKWAKEKGIVYKYDDKNKTLSLRKTKGLSEGEIKELSFMLAGLNGIKVNLLSFVADRPFAVNLTANTEQSTIIQSLTRELGAKKS